VHASAIAETLLVFLHDWLYWATDADRDAVRAVVERADDDPWRAEVRRAVADRDADRLKELAMAPEASAQPPVVLSGLTNILLSVEQREAARSLLREAQQRHPGDFWINYQLGEFLQQEHPAEAAGYFRVAVALRPQNDPAYTLLGRTLRDAGDLDGAIAAFRRAVALNADRGGAGDLAVSISEGASSTDRPATAPPIRRAAATRYVISAANRPIPSQCTVWSQRSVRSRRD